MQLEPRSIIYIYAWCFHHNHVYISLQCDLVGQLSSEEAKAFQELADSCSGGKWICTSAKSGFNVENALSVIVKLV